MDPNIQQPAANSIRRALKRVLLLGYALGAGCLSVWVVSFTPVAGPPLIAFVPSRAGIVLHVRGGETVIKTVANHPAMKEIFDDPDFGALVHEWLLANQRQTSANASTAGPSDATTNPHIPQQIINRVTEREDRLPLLKRWIVKKLLPPRLSSIYPLVGSEVAIAEIVPELDINAPMGQPAQGLILTRVSGGCGLLARIAGYFHTTIPLGQDSTGILYDLGGDVVAIGLRGGRPGSDAAAFVESPTPDSEQEFARLIILPPILQGKRAENEDLTDSPLLPYLEVLAKSIAASILHAPAPADWFGLTETPKQIRLNFYAKDGQIVARGEIDGGVPPIPKNLPDPATEQPVKTEASQPPYLQGMLPLNPQACFLAYITDTIRPERNAKVGKLGFHTKQIRWLKTLVALKRDAEHPNSLDLDEDLWPAFGRGIAFRMEEAPADLSATGYGLLRIAVPFDGTHDGARIALGKLLHGQWDVYDGAPDKDARMPYLRHFDSDAEDRYVLVTGEISAPTLTASDRSVSLTSDAGLFALMGNNPSTAKAPPAGASPQAYFLRIDGRRFAPNVETFATQDFNDTEKKIGTQAFLAKYPNHDAQIARAKKLSGLLGDFYLELKPTGNGHSALTITWTPGTLNVSSAKRETGETQNPGVTPPPPPPGD